MPDNNSSFYQKTVLPGGLKILSERMDNVRSISLGFWVRLGSRDENARMRGGTHFIEHMLFKGTSSRSPIDISQAFESRGAELNAFSSKESTCYYSRLLDEHLPIGIEVLSDMLQNSLFNEKDISSERSVILEEIGMHEDTPEDVAHEEFLGGLWPEHPLGRPVIGLKQTVSKMGKDQLVNLYNEAYSADQIVIAAAGDVNHDRLVGLVEKYFSLERRGAKKRAEFEPVPQSDVRVVNKPTEQAHIMLGFQGINAHSKERFALLMLDIILGGGMSSRLFQEIREKQGLAYSIYSMHGLYSETGYFSVYAGTSPSNADKVVDITLSELKRLVGNGVTQKERDQSAEHLKGSLILNLESTSHRMGRMGKAEMIHGEILSLDEIVDRINSVTIEDINGLASKILDRKNMVLAVVGPFEKDRFDYLKE